MPLDHAQHASPSPAFVRALRMALRPVVRAVMAQGITFPYLAELLKSLMVEVADKHFSLDGKPSTDSRVSLLSGVHRKDVNRLRKLPDSLDEKIPSVVSLGAQLVAQWMGNQLYTNEQGVPLALPRYISDGGQVSFEGLVKGVNSDIRSRVVLDEWMRLGVVSLDGEQRICLNDQAFIPAKGFDEKAFYFGHNLHDHAAAAVHNLSGAQPAFMERSVHYNGLSAESMQHIEAQSKQWGMQALLAVNKIAMEREKIDVMAQAVAPQQRMTFGVYFYAESELPQDTDSAPDKGAGDGTQK